LSDQRSPQATAVPPPARARNRVLDGYRAVAAVGVLTTHVAFQTGAVGAGTLGALAGRLDLGVALFFVLSGFVLYRPYARALLTAAPAPSLRRYLRHRGLRILPAYWLVVVVVLATVDRAGHGPGDLLTQGLLLQTFTADQLQTDLTQTWSLATEVCFYLFLPAYAAAVGVISTRFAAPAPGAPGPRSAGGDLRRRVQVAAGGLVVLLAVWPAWTAVVLGAGHLDARVAMLWLPAHLDWFAAGMALALAREYESLAGARRSAFRTLASTPGACWAAAAALFLVASTPVAGPLTLLPTTALHAATKELLYLLIAALVLVAGVWPLAGSVSERMFTAAPVQALGRWSYGLFLWHLLALDLVMRALHRDPFTGGFWPVLVLTAALGTAMAAASWTLVELPLHRFREPRQVDRAQQGADRG
jgi:peptidoglycan/LPS O-acetylase OafA/YrhL